MRWRSGCFGVVWRLACETITYIFIDKYLGGGRSALALTLIFGLEVWRCVLFAGLFVWALEAG